MRQSFTLAEARALLPELREHAGTLIALRADLTELAAAMQAGESSPLGGTAEVKGLEARVHEQIEWIADSGVHLQGLAPLLVDFPSDRDGEQVLLCWLENEPGVDWWHRPEHGFAGRRPV